MNTETEPSPIRSDLMRLIQRQYAMGYAAGRIAGMEKARELHGAIRRDSIVVTFCGGAAFGLLVGIFAL